MIYRALLEEDFEKLPAALRAFRSAPGACRATGALKIRRKNAFLAWLVRFPAAGDEVPVRLEVRREGDREIWTRAFGGTVRRSVQWASGGLLLEQAGPLRIAFQLHAGANGLRFESRGARIWGIAVPLRVEAEWRRRRSIRLDARVGSPWRPSGRRR